MTPPRDPDEVDQTLLPGAAPSVAPAADASRPDPSVNGTHADNTPAAHADAPLDHRPADPEATLESVARSAPDDASSSESTSDDVEATRMPSGTAAVGVDAADPGATLDAPGARTVGTGVGS